MVFLLKSRPWKFLLLGRFLRPHQALQNHLEVGGREEGRWALAFGRISDLEGIKKIPSVLTIR